MKIKNINCFRYDNADLIENGCVLQEPINNIIKGFHDKKIIISGPSFSGKSLLGEYYIGNLNKTCSKGIYYPVHRTGEDIIYTLNVSREILEQYTRMRMIKKLYLMAKQFDVGLYNSDFKAMDERVRENIKKMISNVNKEKVLKDLLISEECKEKVIDDIKNKMQIESLEIVFDMLDNHSLVTQEVIKEYFDLFDRIIILTKDKDVSIDDKRREDLFNKQYSIIDLEYCYDADVIKSIINSRLAKLQEEEKVLLEYDDIYQVIDPTIFDNIVKEANGNIKAIVSGVYYALDYIINYGRKPLTKGVEYKFLYNVESRIATENNYQKSYPARVLKL